MVWLGDGFIPPEKGENGKAMVVVGFLVVSNSVKDSMFSVTPVLNVGFLVGEPKKKTFIIPVTQNKTCNF